MDLMRKKGKTATAKTPTLGTFPSSPSLISLNEELSQPVDHDIATKKRPRATKGHSWFGAAFKDRTAGGVSSEKASFAERFNLYKTDDEPETPLYHIPTSSKIIRPDIDVIISSLYSKILQNPWDPLPVSDHGPILQVFESWRHAMEKRDELLFENDGLKTTLRSINETSEEMAAQYETEKKVWAEQEEDLKTELKILQQAVEDVKSGIAEPLRPRASMFNLKRRARMRPKELDIDRVKVENLELERQQTVTKSLDAPDHNGDIIHEGRRSQSFRDTASRYPQQQLIPPTIDPPHIIRPIPSSPSQKMRELSAQLARAGADLHSFVPGGAPPTEVPLSLANAGFLEESPGKKTHRDHLQAQHNNYGERSADSSSFSSDGGDLLPDEAEDTTATMKSEKEQEYDAIRQTASIVAKKNGKPVEEVFDKLYHFIFDLTTSEVKKSPLALQSRPPSERNSSPAMEMNVKAALSSPFKDYRGRPFSFARGDDLGYLPAQTQPGRRSTTHPPRPPTSASPRASSPDSWGIVAAGGYNDNGRVQRESSATSLMTAIHESAACVAHEGVTSPMTSGAGSNASNRTAIRQASGESSVQSFVQVKRSSSNYSFHPTESTNIAAAAAKAAVGAVMVDSQTGSGSGRPVVVKLPNTADGLVASQERHNDGRKENKRTRGYPSMPDL